MTQVDEDPTPVPEDTLSPQPHSPSQASGVPAALCSLLWVNRYWARCPWGKSPGSRPFLGLTGPPFAFLSVHDVIPRSRSHLGSGPPGRCVPNPDFNVEVWVEAGCRGRLPLGRKPSP